MGDRLGVVSPAMKAYGQKAQAAGDKIAGIDLTTPAGLVGTALPGGTAGTAASDCPLNHDVPAWGKAIAAEGEKVTSSDAAYGANESGIGGMFGRVLGGQ